MSHHAWRMLGVGVGAIALAACAPAERNGGGQAKAQPTDEIRAPRPAGGAPGDAAMTPSTCDTARRAIEARRFIGWQGLPPACTPDQLVGVAFDETWGLRKLGDRFEPTRMRLLELAGYYRPLVNVRDGAVVMVDGYNPELDGGWPALASDLGTPEASRDFVHGTTPMAAGEHIHAARGITVWVNPDNQFVVHVAVYAPTTVDDYLARLRPSLSKQPTPRR